MLRLVDPLLFVLVSATRNELARQIQFLRAENRILRARIPAKVRLTEPERRRLVRLGNSLGSALREIITIVKYETFRRWKRAMKNRKAPQRKPGPGRPRRRRACGNSWYGSPRRTVDGAIPGWSAS